MSKYLIEQLAEESKALRAQVEGFRASFNIANEHCDDLARENERLRTEGTFRALKVTIAGLAEKYGVQVAEDEYPCIMLSVLVKAVHEAAEARVTQAELETQRWVTAWGEVKRETERLRQECGRLQYEYDNARDRKGHMDWLEKRVTDLEAGLREALEISDSLANTANVGGYDKALTRLCALVGDKK